MYKKWLISFNKRWLFGTREHMAEMHGERVDSVLNAFKELYPNANIGEIFVEYRKRK